MTLPPRDETHNPHLFRAADEDCLATWYHQATPGTTYWRCLVPARHLPGQTVPITPQSLVERDGVPRLADQRGDTAIWQFLGDSGRTRIALGMRELHGTRTLMEVDDNYTRAAPYMKGKNKITPWKEKDDGDGYSHERHRYVAPLVDGIIVSTDYLADIYSDYNENVWVCPNSVDPADWEYERPEPDGIFRIVYYGSPSHVVDAPLATEAMKWAAKQPGVEVWTVGMQLPTWGFSKSVPWQPDLAKAREELFRFDLGIAPLKGNPWSRAKSPIKFYEYAMAGVLPLVSRETPFAELFDYFPDLVVHDDDWLPAVRWAVQNQDDVKARARDAKEWVLEHRSIEKTIDCWREVLNGS